MYFQFHKCRVLDGRYAILVTIISFFSLDVFVAKKKPTKNKKIPAAIYTRSGYNFVPLIKNLFDEAYVFRVPNLAVLL